MITDEAETGRVEQLDLAPLAPGYQGHRIRIRTNTVSGRRIAFVSENPVARGAWFVFAPASALWGDRP